MATRHDDELTSHRSPATSLDDFARARRAFFEMLRRDSRPRRIVECWDCPPPDAGAAEGAGSADGRPGTEGAAPR